MLFCIYQEITGQRYRLGALAYTGRAQPSGVPGGLHICLKIRLAPRGGKGRSCGMAGRVTPMLAKILIWC